MACGMVLHGVCDISCDVRLILFECILYDCTCERMTHM